MRYCFRVESFEHNGKNISHMYREDLLAIEVRKALTHDIWSYLDALSKEGKEILEHNIAYTSYFDFEGYVTYSAILTVKLYE